MAVDLKNVLVVEVDHVDGISSISPAVDYYSSVQLKSGMEKVTIGKPVNNSPNTCFWKDISFLVMFGKTNELRRDFIDFIMLRDAFLSLKMISIPPLPLLLDDNDKPPNTEDHIERQIVIIERYINLLLKHPLSCKEGPFLKVLEGFLTKEFNWKESLNDAAILAPSLPMDEWQAEQQVIKQGESIEKFVKIIKSINTSYERILSLKNERRKKSPNTTKLELRLKIKKLTGDDSYIGIGGEGDIGGGGSRSDDDCVIKIEMLLDYTKMLLEWCNFCLQEQSSPMIEYVILLKYLEDAFRGELRDWLKLINEQM